MVFGFFKKTISVQKKVAQIVTAQHDRLTKTKGNIGTLYKHGAKIEKSQDIFDARLNDVNSAIDEIDRYLDARPNLKIDSSAINDLDDTINALQKLADHRKQKEMGDGNSKADAIYRQKRSEYLSEYTDPEFPV